MTRQKRHRTIYLLLLLGALLFIAPLLAERVSLISKNVAFVTFHVGLSVLVVAFFLIAYQKSLKCKK